MKGKKGIAIGLFTVFVLVLATASSATLAQSPAGDVTFQASVTTAITYQGRLTEGGAPAHGSYDLTFSLYDALAGGAQRGSQIPCDNVAVSNGLFSVDLDFGEEIFDGRALFLEIGVRRGPSTGAYTTLSPRQRVAAAPYALALPGLRTGNLAGTPNIVGGARDNGVIGSIQGGVIAGGGDAAAPNRVSASHGAVGGGLGNRVGGDAATVGGGRDNEANGSRATIGGGSGNQAAGAYATVGGGAGNQAGGQAATAPGGNNNRASGDYSFAAGRNARASHAGAFVWADSTDAPLESATSNQFLVRASGGAAFTSDSGAMLRLLPHAESPNILAGYGGNTLTSGVKGAAIGGGGEAGSLNQVTDHFGVVLGGAGNQAGNAGGTISDAPYGTVAGGKGNRASGRAAAVGGGEFNTASVRDATVAGGYNNTASGQDAVVAGGRGNTASGEDAAVAGGMTNSASGLYACVGGGTLNSATAQSATVGGGNGNTASAANSTVAGGNGNGTSATYAAVGGGRLNAASGTHSTIGGGHANSASGAESMVPGGGGNKAQGNFSLAAGRQAIAANAGAFVWADAHELDFSSQDDNQFSVRATGGVHFVTAIDAEGNPTAGIALAAGGSSWGTPSDRALKENIRPADGREVLARLSSVPISTWNYKAQDDAIRHMGPMAQEFHAAFGLGEDDLHITTVDADGVAFAASQALYSIVQEQEAQIAALELRVAALEAQTGQGGRVPPGALGWLLAGGGLLAGVIVRPFVLRGGRP